jgi:hypothetical protein
VNPAGRSARRAADANGVYRACVNQADLVAWNFERRCPSAPAAASNSRPLLKL